MKDESGISFPATSGDESERTQFMRWWDKFRHRIGDEEAASFAAWSAWLERGRIDTEIAQSTGGRKSALADRLEALGAEATYGPWAWDQRGEKINEWALGTAFDKDEKQLAGRFTDEDAIYDEYVCSHEAATCNYKNPALICELRNNLPEIIAALRGIPSSKERTTFWLWKNFVDGKPEYWAFDNPFPCHDNGDPITLGEPCGYAILKPSKQGRYDISGEEVVEAIKRSIARSATAVSPVKATQQMVDAINALPDWSGFTVNDLQALLDAIATAASTGNAVK